MANVNLNAFASESRRQVFSDLDAGKSPSIGAYSEDLLREGRSKSRPQMGATRFEENDIWFEFIYPDPRGAATVLTVRVPSPDRIVYLPVPEWVVEQIWQGEVTGSYHFRADAKRMLENLEKLLG